MQRQPNDLQLLDVYANIDEENNTSSLACLSDAVFQLRVMEART
jgi:hypothetical protein